MTTNPPDLVAFRDGVMARTGLTNPADVGIKGDGAHQRTGGYHEGMDVLVSIGRYHPPATSHVGSDTEDYSARMLRDREGLTDDASAVDIADNWPHGGRDAWLRFNNLLADALPTSQSLTGIRAINYSPDGVRKVRIDRENGWREESTSDSVTIHTHVEMYRDLEGARQPTLDRLLALIDQAISGNPQPETGDDPMFIGTDGHGRYYLCDGFTQRELTLAEAQIIAYGKTSGYGATFPNLAVGNPDRNTDPNNREWVDIPKPEGGVYRAYARLNPGTWAGETSAPAGECVVDQDQLSTAVKNALSDPVVTSTLEKQINGGLGHRITSGTPA